MAILDAEQGPTLNDRVAELEGQLFLLWGVVTQTLNAMPPKERAAALDAVNRGPRPVGPHVAAFSKALARLGREVRR